MSTTNKLLHSSITAQLRKKQFMTINNGINTAYMIVFPSSSNDDGTWAPTSPSLLFFSTAVSASALAQDPA